MDVVPERDFGEVTQIFSEEAGIAVDVFPLLAHERGLVFHGFAKGIDLVDVYSFPTRQVGAEGKGSVLRGSWGVAREASNCAQGRDADYPDRPAVHWDFGIMAPYWLDKIVEERICGFDRVGKEGALAEALDCLDKC